MKLFVGPSDQEKQHESILVDVDVSTLALPTTRFV
jgi:hypothetical protein